MKNYITNPPIFGGKKSDIEDLAENFSKSLKYSPGGDLYVFVENTLKGYIHVLNSTSWCEIDASGSIIVHGTKDFDIYLSSSISYLRSRFTIAHEIGHYCLHSLMGKQPIKMLRLGTGRLEWEANWFAAAFLMPKVSFIKAHGKDSGTMSLSAQFDVSAEAIEIRKKSLGL